MIYTIALSLIFFSGPQRVISPPHEAKSKVSCHLGNMDKQSAGVQSAIGLFLGKLQTAVAENHRWQVADMISYPLSAWIDGKNVEVQSKQEFVRLYGQVFTKPLSRLLLEQQPACISRVGAQGFSFSKGEMWFDFYPDGSVKVFTVTPIVMPSEY